MLLHRGIRIGKLLVILELHMAGLLFAGRR